MEKYEPLIEVLFLQNLLIRAWLCAICWR